MSSIDVSQDELQQAVSLAQSGERDQAFKRLINIVRREPDHAEAWLWAARFAPDRDKAAYCLKQVLRIDPTHELANNALAKLAAHAPAPAPAPTPPPAPAPRYVGPATQYAPDESWRQTAQAAAPQALPTDKPPQDSTGLLIAGGSMMAVALGALLVIMVMNMGSFPSFGGSTTNATAEPTAASQQTGSLRPKVSYGTDYYTITGSNVNEIRRSILNNGPDHWGQIAVATTTYSYEVTWDNIKEFGSCQVSDVQMNLNIVFLYPSLYSPNGITNQLQEHWNVFINHVQGHEQYHASIAVQCGIDTLVLLRDYPITAGSCDAANAKFEQFLDERDEVCSAYQADFDAREGLVNFPLDK